MDIREYKEAFLSEAHEYLSTLNNSLVVLEKNPRDKERVHAIFRAVHTLKGMSATMGYNPMARLTHQMENALEPIRSGKTELTHALTDALFSCLDLLDEWVEILETQDAIAEGSLSAILFMLDSAVRGERSLSEGTLLKKARPAAPLGPDDTLVTPEEASGETPRDDGGPEEKAVIHQEAASESARIEWAPSAPAEVMEADSPAFQVSGIVAHAKVSFPMTEAEIDALTKLRDSRSNLFQIDVEFDPECTFKDVRAFMVVRNLNEIGEIVQSVPSPEDIEKGRFSNAFHLLAVTDQPAETIRASLMRIAEIADVGVEPFDVSEARPTVAAEPVPIPPGQRDHDDEAVPVPTGSPAGKIPPEVSNAKREAAPAFAPSGSGPAPTIRVHTSKLDKLMALVQELVIAKIRFEQVITGRDLKELQDPYRNLHHITRDLQDEIMQVRLVPIKHIFDRFPRMVRDLAKQLGKEVEFIMEGAEVELDRTIVDELSEPLVHLLRNAIDHGLEGPEERLKTGKSRSGAVSLVAKRERAYVHISVTDDGRGVDIEKVRRKAVALGIVSEDESRGMSDEEIVRFITLPGMSTVQVASDVSGRGVGVDVAKTKIESLGGTLQIQTRKGHGTTFNLKFPLTLAIIKALLVRCRGETFALPVANIVETVDVPPEEIKWVQQQETLLLRDSVVPLYRLMELLELSPAPPRPMPEGTPEDAGTPADPESLGLIPVMIFEIGDYHVGIIVDEVLGQQEIAIKSLDRFLKGIRGFSGATILGNGQICLVLDVAGLLEVMVSRRHHADTRGNPKEEADHAAQSR